MKKSPLEKELKYELTSREYRRLLHALRKKVVRRDRLVTYYLDDPKLKLRAERFGLRVRITNGKRAHVTLKFPAKVRRGVPRAYKIKHEYESPIHFPLAQHVVKGRLHVTDIARKPVRFLQTTFSKSDLAGIVTLGKVTTYRTLARLQRLPIELDRYEMFKKKFYELELETDHPDEADAAIRRLFRDNDISYVPSRLSKLGRFLKEWKKRR